VYTVHIQINYRVTSIAEAFLRLGHGQISARTLGQMDLIECPDLFRDSPS